MSELILLIQQYGLPFVFLNVLVEQAGLPIPAYPTLLVAAALAAGSDYGSAQIVAVAVVAALIADLAWYRAGRRLGFRVLGTLCRVSLSPDSCARRTQSLFTRFGAASLSFAKFVPGFGLLVSALAGASGTSLWAFVAFDVLGATLWSGLAVALGVVFRDAIGEVLLVLESLGRWGLWLLVGALVVYVANKYWQRWTFLRQLRMDRISVTELNAQMQAGQAPVILDVRPRAHREQSGIIPGARAIMVDDANAWLTAELGEAEAEVVVYCACPNEASAALVAKRLIDRGFKKVRPLHGGIEAWVAAGHDVQMPDSAAHLSAQALPAAQRSMVG